MSAQENEAVVRRYIDEVWSQGKLDAVDSLATPDFVRHRTTQPGEVRGQAALKDYVSSNRSAFHDFRVTIDDIVAAEDKVAIRWTGKGVHRGEFFGVAPTGKAVTITGTNILHLRGGKLVAEWSNFDGIGALQQIGALSAAGATAR